MKKCPTFVCVCGIIFTGIFSSMVRFSVFIVILAISYYLETVNFSFCSPGCMSWFGLICILCQEDLWGVLFIPQKFTDPVDGFNRK